MKLIKTLFIGLSISAVLVACGPQISKEKLAQIDELEAMINDASEMLNAVDSATAIQAVDTYNENLHYIQNNLKDTLPRQEAFFVDTYYRLRKIMQKFSENYNTLSSEVVIAKQQLTNLRKDAKNGLVEEKQFDEYLALERQNTEGLFNATKDLMEPFQKALPLYEKKNPRIDSLIQSFEAEQMLE